MPQASVFTTPGPRVFTIAPDRPFLPALAEGLVQALGTGDGLANALVFLPTRRAARGLSAALLDAAGGARGAVMAPSVRTLGDVDQAEDAAPGATDAFALPPAISPLRRTLELSQLFLRKAVARGEPLTPAGAMALAEDLAALIDEAGEHGASLAAAKALYDHIPQHLQDAATFLEIVETLWPARLAELGAVDPGYRRAAAVRALADRWRGAAPDFPVIAAGSTGSQPAVAELLAVIAGLPQGVVVVPGLDQDLDAAAWDAVDEQHPQSGLKRLVDLVGVSRAAVVDWPGGDHQSTHAAATDRFRAVHEALRPAAATSDWLDRIAVVTPQAIQRGFDGLSMISAPDQATEARIIALACRKALAEGLNDVLIVTPDRGLIARLGPALARWGLPSDVSAGAPLSQTAAGLVLQHIVAVAADPGDPLALSALIKHPRARLGMTDAARAEAAGILEIAALRGVRAGADLDAVAARLTQTSTRRDVTAASTLLDEVRAGLNALLDVREETATADVWARALGECVEALAGNADTAWAGGDGAAAAGLIRTLLADGAASPLLTLAEFSDMLAQVCAASAVRDTQTDGAPIRILGPLEARLQTADLVILAGLTEGVWPAAPAQDAFLSAAMRAVAGLAPVERRVGLAAHDFAQGCCAPRVMLTRPERVDGAPGVASRWWWRLENLAEAAGVSSLDLAGEAGELVSIAKALDAPGDPRGRPAPQPLPRPPASARPRSLSVTRVRDLVRDPYAVFAREILALNPLEAMDAPAGPRERGIALHAALAAAYAEGVEGLADRVALLAEAELRRWGFPAHAMASERPRLHRAAAALADWEGARATAGWTPVAFEISGSAALLGEAGLVIRARADRIDTGPGGAAILDYKTGQPPSKTDLASGYDPQLPLEAAILLHGGFGANTPRTPGEIVAVQLASGTQPVRIAVLAEGDEAAELASEAWTKAGRIMARFARQETPYRAAVWRKRLDQTGDYDRLARLGEWRVARPEDGP